MTNTTIVQGTFFGTGSNIFLDLPSGVSWIKVWNYSEIDATNINHGVYYDWNYQLADTFITYHPAADHTLAITTATTLGVPGITRFDTTTNPNGPVVALTSIDNHNPPIVTVASTAALQTGNTVRLYDANGAEQLGGIDFSITVIDGATFSLDNMPPIVAAAGPGSYRVIAWSPFVYYPRNKFITKITQAASAVVTTSVPHQLTVGQTVRIYTNPDGFAAFGMTEMNGLTGNITAVTASTFTVDIDSTAFSAFVFPLSAAVPFSPAIVVPYGEDVNPGDLQGATENVAQSGLILPAGITGAGGSQGDTIIWTAGTNYNI